MSDEDSRVRPGPAEPDPQRFQLEPLLPPHLLRSPELEERLRQTHRKDIDASGPGSSPLWSLYLQQKGVAQPIPSPLWRPETGLGKGPRLAAPVANGDGTLLLSKEAASEGSHVASGIGPRLVAREGEKRPPNTLIKPDTQETKKDAESAWDIGVKAERGAELKQGEAEFGGKSGRTLRQAAGQSLRESGRQFDGKYLKDAEAKAEYKAWEDKGQLKEIKDDTGAAQGKLRAFYRDAKVGGEAAASRKGAKVGGGASAGVGVLTAEGELNKDGLIGAKAKGRAVAADAEAKGLAEVKFAEREATLSGKLAASAVLADGEIGGEIRLTPRRMWNGLVVTSVNTAASWMNYDDQLKKIDKGWDWGLVLGADVSGTVGFAGELSAEGHANKKGIGGSTKVKLAPGLGGGLRLKGGILFGD